MPLSNSTACSLSSSFARERNAAIILKLLRNSKILTAPSPFRTVTHSPPPFGTATTTCTNSSGGGCRRFTRWFRSRAALDALRAMEKEHRRGDTRGSVVLYRYPCFSGAFAALFACLFHARLRLPSLVLPFSFVSPLREDDLKLEFVDACYLIGFTGPDDFAVHLSQFIPRVIAFDHREATAKRVLQPTFYRQNLEFLVSADKSSASAVYEYFSQKLLSHADDHSMESPVSLIDSKGEKHVLNMLRYVENVDLRRWSLSGIKAFTIGLREEHLNLNCITNPYIFDQLLELDPNDLILKGDQYTCSRRDAARLLLSKSFKIRLGRGFCGDCLGVRADGNSSLSHEIGDELSKLSEASGLRPIGAVVFMQRGRMKVCLRSTNSAVDTTEIAKVYGGGGKPGSSSFVIQMDEYNHWISASSW